jgi:transcription elongation GreA/GreB family factor
MTAHVPNVPRRPVARESKSGPPRAANPAPPAGSAPSKSALRDQLAGVLAADLAARERSHKATRAAATHEEAKPENDKDTRALELSYLARGEAMRIEELRTGLAETQALACDPVAAGQPVRLGALVVTDEDGVESRFWIAPHGGGTRLGDVQVVTPKSPLGQALLGKVAGEDCEALVAGRRRSLTIVDVA